MAEQFKAIGEEAQREFRTAAEKLIATFTEKGDEQMIQNNDLIRKYIEQT